MEALMKNDNSSTYHGSIHSRYGRAAILRKRNFMNIISFLGPIIGLLGIGVSITLWLKGRGRKNLSYDIVSSTSLLMHHDELRKSIKIMFEDEEIKDNVHLVLLKIVNNGNVPILAEDFTQDIIIKTTNGSILIAEIKETYPDNLDIKIIDHIHNGVGISPLLLNNKDEIIIKLLIKSPKDEAFKKENLEIKARIVGISDVTKLKPKIPSEFILVFLVIFTSIISLLTGVFLVFGRNQWVIENILMKPTTVSSYIWPAVAICLFGVSVLYLDKKISEKRKINEDRK